MGSPSSVVLAFCIALVSNSAQYDSKLQQLGAAQARQPCKVTEHSIHFQPGKVSWPKGLSEVDASSRYCTCTIENADKNEPDSSYLLNEHSSDLFQ